MEEDALYKIRQHAVLPLHDGPSTSQVGEGSDDGGWLSYLPIPGVEKIKERLTVKKVEADLSSQPVSLFASANGIYLAVAVGCQIFILCKDDDFMQPIGVYTNNDRSTIFRFGAWVEQNGIFSAVDARGTVHVLKANGERMSRTTSKELKLSSPFVAVIGRLDFDLSRLHLWDFCFFTSDGSVYPFDATQVSGPCLTAVPTSFNHEVKAADKQFPESVSCLDFHPMYSLVVLVGACGVKRSSGSSVACSLYVMQFTTKSKVQLLGHGSEYEGSFFPSKGYKSLLHTPRVSISPQVKYAASLDLSGHVNIFKLDMEHNSGAPHPFPEFRNAIVSNIHADANNNHLSGILDITWWTDTILIISKKDDSISMYDIIQKNSVSANDLVISMPGLEGIRLCQGCVFVAGLDQFNYRSSRAGQNNTSSRSYSTDTLGLQSDAIMSCCRIVSLVKVSVSEMYSLIINENRYKEALDFATLHALDVDDVFKAQWLKSDKGISEIDSYLSKVRDTSFVLSECVNQEGRTEAVLAALISLGLSISEKYRFTVNDESDSNQVWNIRLFRLQLLQRKDKLKTFLGINMGRFLPEEYTKFQSTSLIKVATALAESSKIGALNLLYKRHPYTLSPDILTILSSIPETLPVLSYSMLLPGKCPPGSVVLRELDWVECEKMVPYVKISPIERNQDIWTEGLVKYSTGYVWPTAAEISDWYKNRANAIDDLSGQLDNCLSLVEIALAKGITELQSFFDDITSLHQLIFSDEPHDFTLSLAAWQHLSDYEKFTMLLRGVQENTVMDVLRDRGIPFLQKRSYPTLRSEDGEAELFPVIWLKETALQGQLVICLSVIENVCGESPIDGIFKDSVEIIETALLCIYKCSALNQWNTMAAILGKLLHKLTQEKSALVSEASNSHSNSTIGVNTIGTLEKRIKDSQGHVEVGRLLGYYQVPKPMSFFLTAPSDEKNVKQLIRLILSKFGRRQPAKADTEWATLWRDLQSFQEKAFRFLESEYLLTEFIRGLLKAGKFSLARNYLRGTSSFTLALEKAETLVVQQAREYFFSAATMDSNEIWMAKECLSLLPNSMVVQAESDFIDVLTFRLPNLGVSLLPMQFRQMKNPMEIINMAITSQPGAYFNADELIDIAQLLGLRSADDIASVEETIAREAAVNGDLQLAFDICMRLVKKGHGAIWDLCAAIARGPQLENMGTRSRKTLLGFALSHCDIESVGELLNAWKEIDMQDNFEQLMLATGTSPPNFSIQGSVVTQIPVRSVRGIFDMRETSENEAAKYHGKEISEHDLLTRQVNFLSEITEKVLNEDVNTLESILRENRKLLSFFNLELPWLIDLCEKVLSGKKGIPNMKVSILKSCIPMKVHAVSSILYWLTSNGFAPKDDLIATLASSMMEYPVTEEDDVMGCSFLLNLMNPLDGVRIIDQVLKQREAYQEVCSLMNVGMAYSSLNDATKEYLTSEQRRDLMLKTFHEKFTSFSSDNLDDTNDVQNSFWTGWKVRLEEEKRYAEQARAVKQIVPDIDIKRFLSRDANYVRTVLFSLIDSVKMEKKHILRDVVKLAETHGLDRKEVLLHFFACALISDCWENNDILTEISEFRDDFVQYARDVIDVVSSVVYPSIDGHNKQRLSYIYSVLSACYMRLRRTGELEFMMALEQGHSYIVEPFQFCKVLEQECLRVSSIVGLNFKHIARVDDLNFENFNEEICGNIEESTVDSLAEMVQSLVLMYDESQSNGLISKAGVLKHHVLAILASLEGRNEARSCSITVDELQTLVQEIELTYISCKTYIHALSETDISYIMGRYCTLCFPCNFSRSEPQQSGWKAALINLLSFWIALLDDILENPSDMEGSKVSLFINTGALLRCMDVFRQLVANDIISVDHGWDTISSYIKYGCANGLSTEALHFSQAMVFSGCSFDSVMEINHESNLTVPISNFYNDLISSCLLDIVEGSSEHLNLHKLLSSLAKFSSKHVDDLKATRCHVWEKLNDVSKNMQLGSQPRVYALQLMQSITGRNIKSLPSELASQVEPWESWDECLKGGLDSMERTDVSDGITSNLVALKSSQLLSTIYPSAKVTSEHLMTIDSAVSFFVNLCGKAASLDQVGILQEVLEEWEHLFPAKTVQDPVIESPKEQNEWSNDEWGDGWEALPDELGSPGKEAIQSLRVHPLHSCWMEMVRTIMRLGDLQKVMELLDQSSPKSTILDEGEASELLNRVAESDCLMALKLSSLLPYQSLRSHSLQMIETKLREEAISDSSKSDDYLLLTLVLSSGVLHTVSQEPDYPRALSFFCYMVGRLSQLAQHALLATEENRLTEPFIFAKVLLPYFIAELVCAGQHLLAAFIVSRWMRTHSRICILDVADIILRKYLEAAQLRIRWLGDGEIIPADGEPCGCIRHTLSMLRNKTVTALQSALSALPEKRA